MRNMTALWILTLVVGHLPGATAAEASHHVARTAWLSSAAHMQAPPQAAKQPQWKSRDEYDAFNAMVTEKDPSKKISLAEAFLQKYSNSDFKDQAHAVEMQTYQQMNQMDKAVDAAKKAVEDNPDYLAPLLFLSKTFPFLYKADDQANTGKLDQADKDAHHGLELLQKMQKPRPISRVAW